MARFKPAGKGKKKDDPRPLRGLIPCALLVLGGMALFTYFFWAVMSTAPR